MRRSLAPSSSSKKFKADNVEETSNVQPFLQHSKRSTADILSLINSSDNALTDRNESVDPDHKPDQERSCDLPDNRSPTRFPSNKVCFEVLWCKRSSRKHKKWEGDGVLEVSGRTMTLKSLEGDILAQSSGCKSTDVENLTDGSVLAVGSKEVEVQRQLSWDEFRKIFHQSDSLTMCKQSSERCSSSSQDAPESTRRAVALASKTFISPVMGVTVSGAKRKNMTSARFDPTTPGAVVMPRPSHHYQWENNIDGAAVVDVVVDPHLSRSLRPHQCEGVVFLYTCMMGFNGACCGAILADEMGLGKTLQCITLIWTLLRQGPFGGVPVLHQVLIVAPSSLVMNWYKEFHKWLGKERINVYVVDKDHSVSSFSQCRHTPVMLISYEMLTRHWEGVKSCHFQLLICDEGHRLKNGNIKVSTTLRLLECPRRILLTGTPVQNDLREFYQLSDFVQPNVLGTYSEFQRDYESPILLGRQSTATTHEQLLGQRGAEQLASLTHRYFLHRSQHLLTSSLPARIETIVFCRLSPIQLSWYRRVLVSQALQQRLIGEASSSGGWGDSQISPLVFISLLRKLCNHPHLIRDQQHMVILQDENTETKLPAETEITTSAGFELESGKLAVVASLLLHLPRQSANSPRPEKVVLISYYTQTLDLLSSLCCKLGLQCCRLDGSTNVSQRQSLVDSFNSSYSTSDVFLLSAKAGGVGLNLTAASHIILYDIDWNPANDQQALARVWRQGQTRTTRVYRLISAGTIEEVIFQRQISKQALTSAVISSRGARSAKSQFSTEDLRELFTLDEKDVCTTHRLLNCNCDNNGRDGVLTDNTDGGITNTACGRGGSNPGSGEVSDKQERRACQLGEDVDESENGSVLTIASLLHWQHISPPLDDIADEGLSAAKDWITFVLCHSSKPDL